MRYAGIRSDFRANANPLRSIPLFRPAGAVLRNHDARFAAETMLKTARGHLVAMDAFFERACIGLGEANRAKPALRRGRQRKAMHLMNWARQSRRDARKALAAAQAALLALVSDAADGVTDADAATRGYEVGVSGGCYGSNPFDRWTDTDRHDAWGAAWEQGHKVRHEIANGA